MPLEKGAKPGSEGFKKNIETEIAAGKPQKQAVAIAYREARADMADAKFKKLTDLLDEFFREEAKEPEHRGDAKTDGEVLMDALDALRGRVEVAAARKDVVSSSEIAGLKSKFRGTVESSYKQLGTRYAKEAADLISSNPDRARTLYEMARSQLPYAEEITRRSRKDEARADSSPEMDAFRARKAARVARAESGIREADALERDADDALRRLKKAGQTPYPGRASNAKQLVKRARASFGLSINETVGPKAEDWIATGLRELGDAADAVRALREQANNIR